MDSLHRISPALRCDAAALVLTAASSPVTLRSVSVRRVVLLSLEGETLNSPPPPTPVLGGRSGRQQREWVDLVLQPEKGEARLTLRTLQPR